MKKRLVINSETGEESIIEVADEDEGAIPVEQETPKED